MTNCLKAVFRLSFEKQPINTNLLNSSIEYFHKNHKSHVNVIRKHVKVIVFKIILFFKLLLFH